MDTFQAESLFPAEKNPRLAAHLSDIFLPWSNVCSALETPIRVRVATLHHLATINSSLHFVFECAPYNSRAISLAVVAHARPGNAFSIVL
jgi:hypothetical protein